MISVAFRESPPYCGEAWGRGWLLTFTSGDGTKMFVWCQNSGTDPRTCTCTDVTHRGEGR